MWSSGMTNSSSSRSQVCPLRTRLVRWLGAAACAALLACGQVADDAPDRPATGGPSTVGTSGPTGSGVGSGSSTIGAGGGSTTGGTSGTTGGSGPVADANPPTEDATAPGNDASIDASSAEAGTVDAPVGEAGTPNLLGIWDLPGLVRIRAQASQGALKPAYDKAVAAANDALAVAPTSVTAKTKAPPSGDKHDYLSLARYWWPDPNNPNGPYIQKDGQ